MLAAQNSGANSFQNAAANRYARFRQQIQPSSGYTAMAPSGPYAAPAQYRGPQPGSAQVPYGFDPLAQSGQSLQAPSNIPVYASPHGPMMGVPGRQVPLRRGTNVLDEYYAQQGNLIRGGRPADPTTMGHADSAAFAAKLIATLAPVGALSGAMKAPAAVKGAAELPSAIDRIIGGSSAPVQNPGLLSRLGEHADNAERVLAFKSFDRELEAAKKAQMLRRADDQGYTLGAMLRGETPPHIQSPFTTAKNFSRRAGDIPQPTAADLPNWRGYPIGPGYEEPPLSPDTMRAFYRNFPGLRPG